MTLPLGSHRSTSSRAAHVRALLRLSSDLLVPLALYYGLRLVGADAWLALLISAAVSVVVVIVGLVRRRRIDRVVLFSLSLLTAGTLIGFLAGDPRALMARGSWLTAAVGVWILLSLFASRPILYDGTLSLMPPAAAAEWRTEWTRNPAFRRLLRQMTAAFGVAFLLDAAARVVMAYTLPLDLVPILANLLLVAGLAIIVLAGKARGNRISLHRSTSAGEDGPHEPEG